MSYGDNEEVHPDAPAGGGGPGHFRSPQHIGHHSHTVPHIAHISHQVHLAAEAAESLAHQAHHAATLNKALQVMRAHSDMAWDLKLMRRGMRSIENVATQTKSAKALAKLAEVKAAYAEAEAVFKADRAATAAASKLIETSRAAARAARGFAWAKGAATAKVGAALTKFEQALEGSAMGRGVLQAGKFVTNPKVVKGLIIVGAAFEGIAGWIDSNAQTTGGKAANAVLAAGGGALVMANPLVAGADVIAPKGYKLSEVYQGTAGALSSIGEGLWEHDETAMAQFHERSKAGDYGKVMQAASEAGDFWAEKGLTGGLSEFVDAVKYSISGR